MQFDTINTDLIISSQTLNLDNSQIDTNKKLSEQNEIDIQNLKSIISTLTANTNSIDNRVTILENTNSDLAVNMVNTLATKVNFIAGDLDSLKKTVAQNVVNITQNTFDINELKNAVYILQIDVSDIPNLKFQVKNNTNEIADTSKNSPLKTYIDTMDFLNLSPLVGYFDSDRTVKCDAYFNMNWQGFSIRDFPCCTDVLGQEVAYFCANNGESTSKVPMKMYKAVRLTDKSDWIYYNQSLRPAYMEDSDYPIKCWGLGYWYIIYSCRFKGQIKTHLVITDGSSDASTWTNYKDITSICSVNPYMIMAYRKTSESEPSTICVIPYDINDLRLKVYDYNNLSRLIKDNDLISPRDLIRNDSTCSTLNSATTYYDWAQGSAVWLPNEQKLIWNTTIEIKATDISKNTMRVQTITIELAYNCTVDDILGLTSNVSCITPASSCIWGWNGYGASFEENHNSIMIYDESENKIHYSMGWRDCQNVHVYRADPSKQNFTKFSCGRQLAENFSELLPPDTCP